MSENSEYDGDPIDASWSTAPWNNDGETVEASDDDAHEGNMKTIDWPENATPKEELNDDQIAVIKAAAKHPNNNSSTKLTQIAVGDEKSKAYAGNVIRSHWHERYWNNQNECYSDELVKELREKALNGATARGLSEKYSPSHSEISRMLAGKRTYSEVSDPPALSYDRSEKVYKINNRRESDEGTKYKHFGKEYESEASKIEAMRQMALEGANRGEIAEKFNTGSKNVGRRLRKNMGYDVSIPTLTYDQSQAKYIVDGEKQNNDTHQKVSASEGSNKPSHPTKSNQSRRWVAAVVVAVVYLAYRFVRRST